MEKHSRKEEEDGMRRPLCLLCMVFVGALVIGLLCGMDAAVDYGELEGRTVVAEGQVYRREYKGQRRRDMYFFIVDGVYL